MVKYEPFEFYRLAEEVVCCACIGQECCGCDCHFRDDDSDWRGQEESLADQLAAEAIAEDAAENLEEK